MLYAGFGKDPKNKWGNHEKIPLNKECQSLLAKIKKEPNEDRIFPYKSSSVSSKFSEITQLLGMKKVSFHSCRHEGISRLFEQGHTIPQVAVHSGHKSWENLKRYTHLMQRKTPDLYKMCMEIEAEFTQNILNN
ncbi:tyrosine-type recombinase/integrase [Endozoicomonas sp. SCSIO W0465]|uniref:tyrosine-type recombinase/integrase n=1 Tax=Endozoicomonas sp. SCSIO W0465 TaxID=2918516 RepID=UPI0020757552|nr:tyrosine-type recombinase/integrase [Endozoicomonas sp. SCSIO W0465]USE37654.1 tyrosine-type recombinase/integrase [Endozoicomonas sp. SCSIO W0465]